MLLVGKLERQERQSMDQTQARLSGTLPCGCTPDNWEDRMSVTKDGLLGWLEQEREATLALLPRFSDEQWAKLAREDGWTVHDIAVHMATSNYGLAGMALGEIPAPPPAESRKAMMASIDQINETMRARHQSLPREKTMQRVGGAFDQVRRAIETLDLAGPSLYPGFPNTAALIQMIVGHSASHRAELEAML